MKEANMNPTDQIAAEAAEKVLIEVLPEEWRGYREPLLIRVSAIIKSAIEKATANYRRLLDLAVAKLPDEEIRAAHASEPTGQDTKRLDWLLTDAGRTWIYWRGQRKPPRIVNRTTIDAAMSEDLAK